LKFTKEKPFYTQASFYGDVYCLQQ